MNKDELVYKVTKTIVRELEFEWLAAGRISRGHYLATTLYHLRDLVEHLQAAEDGNYYVCDPEIVESSNMPADMREELNEAWDSEKQVFFAKSIGYHFAFHMIDHRMAYDWLSDVVLDANTMRALSSARHSTVRYRGHHNINFTSLIYLPFSDICWLFGPEYGRELAVCCEAIRRGWPPIGELFDEEEYGTAAFRYMLSVIDQIPEAPLEHLPGAADRLRRYLLLGTDGESPASGTESNTRWTKPASPSEWVTIFRNAQYPINRNQFIRDIQNLGLVYKRLSERGAVMFREGDLLNRGIRVPDELRQGRRTDD